MAEKELSEIPFPQQDLFEKGVAALKKNNLDYAITLFMTVLRAEPGVYQAREALRATQHKRAVGKTSFFRKFVGSASSLTRGQVALRTNPVEALAVAEEVLNDDPGNVAAHELLAHAALAVQLPKTAALSLEVAFKQKPADRGLALELAQALAAIGNRARAEKILLDLLRVYPADPDLNERLKNILADRTMAEQGYGALEDGKGSYRDIIRDKQEAVTLEQEQRSVKDADVAGRLIGDYEKRLAAEPGSLKTMRDLADLHRKRHEYPAAIAYYQRILTTGGVNDPAILELIRSTVIEQFEHEESQLDPAAADHAGQLAEVRSRRMAWQLEDARSRADQNPSDLALRYELGQLYLAAGRLSEAIAELQKAQNNQNKRIASMTLLAQAFARRGMNDLAARKLQEALKEKLVFDEEAKELRYQLGVILDKMAKKEEAIEQFKLIYEQDVNYRDVMARVDAYYAAQG